MLIESIVDRNIRNEFTYIFGFVPDRCENNAHHSDSKRYDPCC